MPVFSYKGFDTKGKPVTGVQDADSLKTLRANLRRDGVLLTEAKEAAIRAVQAGAQVAGISILAMFNPVAAARWWNWRRSKRGPSAASASRLSAMISSPPLS